MKKALLSLFLLALPFLLVGKKQKILLNGILTAQNGDAIPGCSVYIKGTQIQSYTQICGEFEIEISENYNETLSFSCLRERTWEIPTNKLKDKEKIIIYLKEWFRFENGKCDKNYKQEKRIKIK